MFARLTNLLRNLAIYGLGDVAVSLVSLLLLPVYTRFLSPSDYGIIAMLLTIEAVTKVLFRWGVDTAFMRLYYDCSGTAERQRLASTVFFFLLGINGALLAVGVSASSWLSTLLFETTAPAKLIALTITNTFIAGFFFIPLQVLRIRERSGQFIALVFSRSAGTLVARLTLVVGAGMGVLGVVVADITVTTIMAVVFIRWYAPLIRPVFSRTYLRELLGFGLPRVPHSVAHQVIGLADRYFLNAYGTLREVGLYSVGASFGTAPKLFLSAFEYAWTPFFLGAMKEPDAKRIYSSVSTYVLSVLVLIVAGLSAAAPDLIRLATAPQFHGAAVVTPWIALGVLSQGVYILGSIGLVITKRTAFYPIATGTGAVASLTANALLIPRYGLMGAAWANAIAYGTLSLVTVGFSLRQYPIRYEWARVLRLAAGGGAAFLAGSWAVPPTVSPFMGVLLRSAVTLAVYVLVLGVTGFFHAGELRRLRQIRERVLRGRVVRAAEVEPEQTELAGTIVATGPELVDSAADEPGERREPPISPDSRASRD